MVPKIQFRGMNVLGFSSFRARKQNQTWEGAEPMAAQLSSMDALPAQPWFSPS